MGYHPRCRVCFVSRHLTQKSAKAVYNRTTIPTSNLLFNTVSVKDTMVHNGYHLAFIALSVVDSALVIYVEWSPEVAPRTDASHNVVSISLVQCLSRTLWCENERRNSPILYCTHQ